MADPMSHRTPLRRWTAALAPLLLLAVARAAAAQEPPVEPFPEPKPEPKPAPKLTKPPQVVRPAEPVYPPDALAEGRAADVTLTVDLDGSGKVTSAVVPNPVGHGFDEAAIAAIKASEFSPAEVDGKPSPIRFSYTLHFVPKMPPPRPDGGPADGGGEAPDGGPPPPAAAVAVPPGATPLSPPPPPDLVIARGRIREKGTRDPVQAADVAVIVRTAEGGAQPARVVGASDENGDFEIRGQPGVPLRVVVGDSRHEPCIRDIDGAALRPESPVVIDCTVMRRTGARYETRVSAPRETQSATRYTLSQPELGTVPGTFGDPLRVIQNLPGVARTPFGLGLLVIRGSSPQDTGVFIEGHQIPILYHFLGGPSVLTPRLIDRIDFFPGNFGTQYGRFTAGIIDVGIKTDPSPRVHGSADLNLLDSSAYVQGPLGKGWSGEISGRRSYIDLLLPLVLPSNTTTAAPVYWDYQAGAHHELAGGRISLFAFGSNDSLKVVSNDPNRGDLSLDTETGFHRLLAIWSRTFGGWTNKLSPAIGYDRLVLDAGQLNINRSAYIGELRDELTRVFRPGLSFRLGFDGQVARDSLFFDLPIPPMTRVYGQTMPVFQKWTIPLDRVGAALYSDLTWDLGHGLRLIPGIRGDYFHYVGQDRFTYDPRLVVRWMSSPVQTWKAGAGLFHQMPEPQLLNSQAGNPSLPPIYATQYSAGFERKLTAALSVDATAYLVYRYNEPVDVAGIPPFEPNGEQRSYGLELLIKHAFTERFWGWLAYTLSRSEETTARVGEPTTADNFSLASGPTPKWTPTAFDQTHNLILVASYRLRAWQFGTRFRVVTGSPTTPLLEGVYDADRGDYVCRQAPQNSAREPTFSQLDLRVDRTWTFNSWQFGAYVDVQNVYNATNPEATIYDYRCRGSEAIRGIPFLPVFGIKGLF